MTLPVLSGGDALVLVTTALVLVLPGACVGVAWGLRGWRLVGTAPLLTVAVVGLGGPWSSGLGLAWGPLTLVGATALASLLGVVRVLARRSDPVETPPWRAVAHAGVGSCVAVAGALGAVAVLVGFGRLDGISRGWDAAFHANGIRWIIETGEGSVSAMTRVNWYASPGEFFYPNAYHLVAAVVARITGATDATVVLNALVVWTPWLFALGMVTLVHAFAGRAVTAGASALVVVAAGSIMDLLWLGPLLPYAFGLALIPPAVVLVVDVMRSRTTGAQLLRVPVVALAAAALVSVHPAIMITALVFAVPAAVASTWGEPARTGRGVLALAVAGVVTAAMCLPQIRGALSSAANDEVDYPAVLGPADAVGRALLFQHEGPYMQVWLALATLIGLITYRQLGSLRWVVIPAVVFGLLFVAAAAYDTDWSLALTRPWWNDRTRLIAAVVVALSVIAAHGLGELQRVIAQRTVRITRSSAEVTVQRIRTAVAVAVLVALVLVSGGLYHDRHTTRMSNAVGVGPDTGQGPLVTEGERAGFRALADIVQPGERVMNDPRDGSTWMYALEAVPPVFGHFDKNAVSPEQILLLERFDQYDTDPVVRAAVDRLDVRWVAIGDGFIGDADERAPGLDELDDVEALTRVYVNPDIVVYRLDPAVPGAVR